MSKNKIILDLCGGTGAWSNDYREAGYDVRIITLPDYDITNWRLDSSNILIIKGTKEMYIYPEKIYGILAAPPCYRFSFAKTTGKPRELRLGMEIAIACLQIIWECQYQLISPYAKITSLKFWALENPNGMLKYFLGKPAFEFNPYDFGDNYKKKTHLWGWFNEPKKSPIKCNKPKFDRLKTKEIHPEFYGKFTRQERRAITPQGFARAFYEANK